MKVVRPAQFGLQPGHPEAVNQPSERLLFLQGQNVSGWPCVGPTVDILSLISIVLREDVIFSQQSYLVSEIILRDLLVSECQFYLKYCVIQNSM